MVLVRPVMNSIVKKDDRIIAYTGDTTICDGLNNLVAESEMVIIDGSRQETNEQHLGHRQLVEIVTQNQDKTFFVVHYGDYEHHDQLANVIYPTDGVEMRLE